MLASEHFRIDRTDEDDWFDPILDFDTPLGIDPFLIFHETDPLWDDAHEELIRIFSRAFLFVADGIHNTTSLSYRKAVGLLHFKEPEEFCLGYTKIGTSGAGGAAGKAEPLLLQWQRPSAEVLRILVISKNLVS
jgi:hypothetical protein